MTEQACICGRDAYQGPGAHWLQHGPGCPAPFDTTRAARRYCEILRGMNPSPAVLRAIEAIEAELDDHPTGNQP